MDKKSMTFYVIIASSLASFITAYVSSVSVIALPQIASTFSLSNILQNWVVNIFLLTMAALSVPFGKLCSKWGLKKSLLTSETIFFIGTLGIILSFNISLFFFFRIIQAIGAVSIFISAVAMLVKAVPTEELGKALGINISCGYIGVSLSPLIGGTLIYNFGWQSIFTITLPIILLIILILSFKITSEWKINENDPIDIKGSLIYIIGTICFIYGFTILNKINGIILVIIGVIFTICFALYELRIKYPLFEVRLYKNHKFLSANIASTISYLALYSVTTILNYHFQYICGYNPQIVGLILVVTPIMQAIVTPKAGKLADKVNPQKLAAIGMSFITCALFLLTFISKYTPLWIIILAMILQGIGCGLFNSPNTTTIMTNVPRESTGMASAALSTMRVIGQTMSMGLLTVIFAFVMGNVIITPKVYSGLSLSFHYVLIIATILAFITVLVSLIGMKSSDKLKY